MRLVHVRVPGRHEQAVFDHLEGEGIEYVVLGADDDGDGTGVTVEFPLPTSAVDDVLADLDDIGLGDEYWVVTEAEVVETPTFDRLEERYENTAETDIAPAELRSRALEMAQRRTIYYSTTLLSAAVAVAGLLLDAPAVVVGSMVIAPQVGAALKTSVGTILADRDMMVEGLWAQLFGLALAVVGAAAFGAVVQWLGVGPARLPSLALEQIHQRVSPGVLSVAVAVAAGFAAAVSLATAVPTSLVGVMIAAALIPAAAAVGIGIAYGVPTVALGALVLLTVNTAAINLTGILGLWALGYRPGSDGSRETNHPGRERSTRAALATLLAVSLLFAGSGYVTVQHVAFERAATEVVDETMAAEEYDRLTVVTVEARFGRPSLVDGPRQVTVVVKRPADAEYPDLASTLRRRLTDRLDRPVGVEVEFRDATTAGTESDAVPGQAPLATTRGPA